MAQAPSPSTAPYIESATNFGDGSDGAHSSGASVVASAATKQFTTFNQSGGTYTLGGPSSVLQCKKSFSLTGIISGRGLGGNPSLAGLPGQISIRQRLTFDKSAPGGNGLTAGLQGLDKVLAGNYSEIPGGGGNGGLGQVATFVPHYHGNGPVVTTGGAVGRGGASLCIVAPTVQIGADGDIDLRGTDGEVYEYNNAPPNGPYSNDVKNGNGGAGTLFIVANDVTIAAGATLRVSALVVLYTNSFTKTGATLPDNVYEKQLRLVGPETEAPSPVVVAFQNKVRDWLLAEMTSPAYGVFGDASYPRGKIVHTRNMMIARAVLVNDGAHLATAATRTLIDAELDKRSGAFFDRMDATPWNALLTGNVNINKRFYSSQDSTTATHADGSALWEPSTVVATTVIPEFNSVKFHDVYRWLGFAA